MWKIIKFFIALIVIGFIIMELIALAMLIFGFENGLFNDIKGGVYGNFVHYNILGRLR